MKLINKNTYREIEKILFNAKDLSEDDYLIKRSLKEINSFFYGTPHAYFIENYYYKRYLYINRYNKPSDMLAKLAKDLYSSLPNLYQIKREVVYKAAMIFYKNGVLK